MYTHTHTRARCACACVRVQSVSRRGTPTDGIPAEPDLADKLAANRDDDGDGVKSVRIARTHIPTMNSSANASPHWQPWRGIQNTHTHRPEWQPNRSHLHWTLALISAGGGGSTDGNARSHRVAVGLLAPCAPVSVTTVTASTKTAQRVDAVDARTATGARRPAAAAVLSPSSASSVVFRWRHVCKTYIVIAAAAAAGQHSSKAARRVRGATLKTIVERARACTFC